MATSSGIETPGTPGLRRVLRENGLRVLAVVAAFAAFGTTLNLLTPPAYRATVRVELPAIKSGGGFDAQIAAFYRSAELITDRGLLERLAVEAGWTNPDWLEGSIHLRPVAGSRRIDLSVEDSHPERARLTADRLAALFVAVQSENAPAMVASGLSIVAPAVVGTDPVRPRIFVNLAVCLAAGLLSGIGFALVRSPRPSSMHAAREAEPRRGVPVRAHPGTAHPV